jgi:AcrR family transcriptional regulator
MSALSNGAPHKVKKQNLNRRNEKHMGERPVTKAAAKREARICDILECAEKQFAQKGFHGAGISAIAADCNMSVGHLYHYFSSKDELIQAVVDMEMSRQQESVATFENLSPENMRVELMELMTEIFSTDQDPFRAVLNFEILAEAQRNPDVAVILQKHDKKMRDRFIAVLKHAGIDDPELRTELIFSLFSGLAAQALRHPEQEREALLETMKDVVLKILGENAAAGNCAVCSDAGKLKV